MLLRWAWGIPIGEAKAYSFIGVIVIALPIWLVIWGLAISDAFNKTPEQYVSHSTKSKKIALFLTFLFGSFGWLYTYSKDAIKFWMAIVILLGSLILVPVYLSFTETAYPTVWRYLKDFLRIPGDLFLDLIFYYFDYYLGVTKPISFLVPAFLWAVAVATNIIRLIKRDDSIAETISVPED
ncbi:hypothetical protein ACFLV1_01460 [Chloroflexota bacterium]